MASAPVSTSSIFPSASAREEPSARRAVDPQVALGTLGWSRLTLVVIVVGVAARVARWLDQRPLWLDEAMLAINVASRSWSTLLGDLDYAQVGPPGFLLLERLAVVLGGASERSLRVCSLLAGVAAVVLAWRVLRGLLAPRVLFLVVALVASSPLLIRYADDVKQYSGEVCIALLVALATRRMSESPGVRALWMRVVPASTIAFLLSMSAFFVVPAAALALLLEHRARSWLRANPKHVLGALAVVAPTALLAFALERHILDDAYTRAFWEFAFLRVGAPDLAQRTWSAANTALSGFLVGSLDAGRWGAWIDRATDLQTLGMLAAMALGAWHMARRVPRWLMVLAIAPIVIALAASAAGRFPVSGRTMLFTAPFVFVLAASGVEQVREVLARRANGGIAGLVWGLAATALLIPAVARMAIEFVTPYRRQDIAPLLAELERERHPGDVVYVSASVIPAWTFHTTNWSSPDRRRLAWIIERSDSDGPLYHSHAPRGDAVIGSGDSLALRTDTLTEVFGLSTGRLIYWGGFVNPLPDAGWAANEARRIADAAASAARAEPAPSAWVLYVPHAEVDRAPAFDDLQREIAARGGRLVSHLGSREADLLRYRFDGAPRPAIP